MLIGTNIRLRPITVDDAQRLADWYNDPEYLGAYYNIWPSTRQRWEQSATRERKRDEGDYLIISRAADEPMGAVGYFNPFTLGDLFKGYELWWQLHHAFEHRDLQSKSHVCLSITCSTRRRSSGCRLQSLWAMTPPLMSLKRLACSAMAYTVRCHFCMVALLICISSRSCATIGKMSSPIDRLGKHPKDLPLQNAGWQASAVSRNRPSTSIRTPFNSL